MPKLVPFPDLLREYLHESRLRQSELGRRVGLSRTQISRLVSGKRRPAPDLAAALCAALNLSKKDCQRLTDAVHLARATPYLREMFERRSR